MEVILVVQPITASLDHTDVVVQAFHEAQRHLVLWLAVRRNTIPVRLDQFREVLERRQPLPSQRGAPVLEELPRPGFAPVRPQLRELLLEHLGRVESVVRREQRRQPSSFCGRQILPVRQQDVLLAFDVLTVGAVGQPFVLGLADPIHRVVQMA